MIFITVEEKIYKQLIEKMKLLTATINELSHLLYMT